jgi:tetratricopeptide (TPR) repeat protein
MITLLQVLLPILVCSQAIQNDFDLIFTEMESENYSSAESKLKKILQESTITSRAGQINRGKACYFLYGVYRSTGFGARADSILTESIWHFETFKLINEPFYSLALSARGRELSDEGRDSLAEPILRKSVQLRKRVKSHTGDSLIISTNLIACLVASGKYSEADTLAQNVLKIYEMTKAGKLADYINVISLYGSSLGFQENYLEAELILSKGYLISKGNKLTHRQFFRNILLNLGVLNSELYFRESNESYKYINKPNLRQYKNLLNNRALNFCRLLRFAEAIEAYAQNIVISQKIYGKRSYPVYIVMNDQAATYMEAGDLVSGANQLRNLLDSMDLSDPQSVKLSVTVETNYIIVLGSLSRCSEAAPYLEKMDAKLRQTPDCLPPPIINAILEVKKKCM